MRRRTTLVLCRCGHPFLAHEHLRLGTDCSWCARSRCGIFRGGRVGKLSAGLKLLRKASPSDLESDSLRLVVVR